jgi:CUE domain
MAEAAQKLISELKGDRLTSHQLYTLGQVLCHLPEDSALAVTCQKLLAIVPAGLFADLDEALVSIPWSEVDSIRSALQSILALNRIVKSPPRKAPSATLIRHLISKNIASTPSRSSTSGTREDDGAMNNIEVNDLSLEYIRLYLIREREIDIFLPILHQLQEDQRLWSRLVQLLASSSSAASDWHDAILRNFPADQSDYLSTLLKNVDADASTVQSTSIKTAVASVPASSTKKQHQAKRSTASKATPEQEMTRRIEQVKMVIPDYGEGFIEAALSQFQGNVETTVARLLEPVESWPSVLRTLDTSLPRRAQRIFDVDDPETRAIVKARIKEAAAQEEKEALLLEVAMRHDEYEDDYDDQYDDMDGGAGNVDIPDDYEAVRTYNRVLRGIEAEQTFFDDIRNSNRDGRQQPQAALRPGQAKKTEGSDANKSDEEDGDEPKRSGEKMFRGPDRLRGGRTPGAGGRGGGRGRGRQGPAVGDNTAAAAATTTNNQNAATANGRAAAKPTQPNVKSKQRKLAKRRDQQKNAQVKRAG